MTFEQAIGKDVARIKAMLIESKQTVATAESITSGLIAYALTSVAGSSDYFKQGWVVYQSESKHTEMVLPRNVEIYSADCAKHLAMAAKTKAGTDWGIGITGKADPGDGKAWWGIARPDNTVKVLYAECKFDDRNGIRTDIAAGVIKHFRMMIARINKGK